MKKITSYFIIVILPFSLFAQNNGLFRLYDTGSNDQARIYTRTCDKGFILGGITDAVDPYFDAYIVKIDSIGNELWNWNVGFGGASDGPVSIMETPDSNIIVFYYSMSSNARFRMAVFDYDGSLLHEKHDYYLSNGFPEFMMYGAILLPDSRILTPVVVNDSILKVYWWNQTGDTLSSLILDTCRQFPGGSSEKVERLDCFFNTDTITFCYNNFVAEDEPSKIIMKTDYNGTVIDKKEQVIDNVSASFKAVKSKVDNKYAYFWDAISGNCISSCIYDGKSDSVYTWVYYQTSAFDILTSLGADFITEDTLLFCGNAFSYIDMKHIAHILKIDTSGNLQWLQTYEPYGYDYSYLWSVKQFPDCIAAVGYSYNSSVSGSYDILFVKADLNGEATSISTFEQPGKELRVFPNPVSDILSVNLLPIGESNYTILDTEGRIILKGRCPGNQVDVSSLPPAYYFLKWENDGKIYEAEFIKE